MPTPFRTAPIVQKSAPQRPEITDPRIQAYIIEVELPRVRREDVDVTLNGNFLVVTGDVKERERGGLFRRRTRRVGEFEFRVTLPGYLREGDIEASLAYGVLKVSVPKAESTKSSKSTVSESGDGSPS